MRAAAQLAQASVAADMAAAEQVQHRPPSMAAEPTAEEMAAHMEVAQHNSPDAAAFPVVALVAVRRVEPDKAAAKHMRPEVEQPGDVPAHTAVPAAVVAAFHLREASSTVGGQLPVRPVQPVRHSAAFPYLSQPP